MKSKTLKRFIDGLFYIKCESQNENLEIRNLCEECGLNVFGNWGIYKQNTEHVLSYKLIASKNCKGLITSRVDIDTKMLAKDFIKEVKEEMNDFKKSDLVSAQHVVRIRDGNFYIYILTPKGGKLIRLGGFIWLKDYNNDLLGGTKEEYYDIMEVYKTDFSSFNSAFHDSKLTSVWKRKELTEAEKQLEEAKRLLLEAQEAVRKAQSAVAVE